jgi:AcrR family transcriptional regulator
MVASAAALLGSRGVSATSFSAVLAASRAPRGSIYHYFPDGKRQLVKDALRWTTEQILAYQSSCSATTSAGVLDHFVRLFRRSVVTSGCQAGCPVAGVVIDADADMEYLRETVRTSFRAWTSLLTQQLMAVGTPQRSARALSLMTVASVEGALILCRAEGSVAPLDAVARQLRQLASRSVA